MPALQGADKFFIDGCMRCKLGATPECKVHFWDEPLALLRQYLLDCNLVEELKWGMPTYTFKSKNIIMLGAFKDSCIISFLKGALLKDAKKLLVKPGENTQGSRVIKFTEAKTVAKLEKTLKAYIYETVALEESGAKVEYKKNTELELVAELQEFLLQDAALKKAFEALTPGRQRGYNIYFSGAKQSATRISRIEKYRAKILQGKGFMD
jgi:uncharacterized protein YdeI (YjbR/CyaY-like superfamily)